MKDNLFYRFRSTTALFEFQELENQEIYFAPIDKLNDPMEGELNLVFKGDKIVWENLFKHFISCLDYVFLFLVMKPDWDFTWKDIPFDQDFDTLLTLEYRLGLARIKKEFIQNCNGIIQKLANRAICITKLELEGLLSRIYFYALFCIAKYRHNNSKIFFPKNLLINIEHRLELLNDPANIPLKEACYRILNSNSTSIMLKTENRLRLDFVDKYFQILEYLTRPEFRVACFSANTRNSAMWGHYADSHKGVCLIFRANHKKIRLLFDDSEYDSYCEFKPIIYKKSKITLNFFENISALSYPQLLSTWHRSEYGKISNFYKKTHRRWNKDHAKSWEIREKAYLRKSRHWKYEEEYRLLKTPSFSADFGSNKCKAKYRFQDLEGIIFGIKTSMADKIKIFNIIKEKCQKEKRTDFKFYQAYFCHKTQQILYFPIV